MTQLKVHPDRLGVGDKDIVRVEDILKGNRNTPLDLIKQRRELMLIHSFLYYVADSSVMSDLLWQQFANDLVVLQDSFPELCQCGYYDSAFAEWDASTGMGLPYDENIVEKAKRNYRMYTGRDLEWVER